MLLDLLETAFAPLLENPSELVFNPFLFAGVLGLVYACWWHWKFTIEPLLYPGKPPNIPYYIPCEFT